MESLQAFRHDGHGPARPARPRSTRGNDTSPAEEPRRKVTLADVAREALVSPAAASLAIRGEPGVSRETRDRVLAAARRIGYRGVARVSTRRMKSVTIGLIIKAPVGDAPEANRFYAPVMAGIEELCRVRDIDLLFAAMPVDADYHPIEVPRLVADRATDGLIIIGAHLSDGTASALVDWPPSILVDAYAEDASVDSVVSDNVGGARAAVEHLISRGHRDIALVGARSDSFPSVVQRRRGYEQAIAEAELRPHVVEVPHVPPEAAGVAAIDALQANPEITAVFGANDAVAIEVVRAAQRAGLNVPRDLSVVGYDDIDLARFITPQLTTMAVDKLGMGRLALTMLLHRLEFPGDGLVQAVVRTALVERMSVARRAADDRRNRPTETASV
jgi:LacI family transcriptional regulator